MIAEGLYSHISPAYQHTKPSSSSSSSYESGAFSCQLPWEPKPNTERGYDVSSDQPALTSPTWCCREQQVRARAWSLIFTGTTPQLMCARLKWAWGKFPASYIQIQKKETHVSTQRELCDHRLYVQSDQSLTARLLINPGGMWDQASNYIIHGFTVAGRTGWLSSRKPLSDFKWAPAVFIQRRHDLCHKASIDTVDASCSWSPRSHQDQIQIRSRSDPDQIQTRTALTPSSVTGSTHTEERVMSAHTHIFLGVIKEVKGVSQGDKVIMLLVFQVDSFCPRWDFIILPAETIREM